jgi:superfamily II DNA or RNA helicase
MPLPKGIEADRGEAADKILKMGNVAVCKPTRAGFTTSEVIAAKRRVLKTLVIAPTRNILTRTVRETVERVGGLPCDIPGHNQCKYVQKRIKNDPLLKKLPIMIKDWTAPLIVDS